jgi:L,D-transpeptidase YbiS
MNSRRAPHLMVALPGVLLLSLSANFATGFSLGDIEPSGAEVVAPDSISRALRRLEPRGSYIVIDRANNRLWVRNSREVLRDAVVSTGSGTILREIGGLGREWAFETPKGVLSVLAERRNPVWVKPDWAFLEEGRQPPNSTRERVEAGSLGEWALDLGDGYMIHGTLYERLLGRSVTHGCIRVGRDDLRFIAGAVRPGTPVYVF